MSVSQAPAESLARIDLMTVNTNISKADHVAFARFLIKKNQPANWQVGLVFGVFIGIGILLEVCFMKPGQGVFIWIFFAGFGCATLLIVLNGRLVRRKLQPDTDSCLFGPRQISIENEGCREISPDWEYLYRWSAIRNVEVTDQYVFVMIDHIAGMIVPRKTFSSNTECLQFVNEIQKRSAKAL